MIQRSLPDTFATLTALRLALHFKIVSRIARGKQHRGFGVRILYRNKSIKNSPCIMMHYWLIKVVKQSRTFGFSFT